MASSVKNPVDITRLPVNKEEHKFEDWIIKYQKSHILSSKCTNNGACSQETTDECQFCRYSRELSLPHMPDMVFPKNELCVQHVSGVTVSFNALDALKQVNNGKLDIKIACADAWKESRQETGLADKEIQSFDWTFSTDYCGSLSGNWTVESTELRIDMERLKQKEKILFYHEVNLFEDELHDNGIASLNVKIRVMPSGFFLLLRFFLRVDGVMLRVNDTRYYHDFTTQHVLREFTSREGQMAQLQIPLPITTDPNEVAPLLPIKTARFEKLTYPTTQEVLNVT
ncbi:TIP41-like protein [Homalodisca vitripennis]|uniref:TIP41-like protein n=1 Tax=Homalodisca vitripennis TaxID=197043 RepID=UPI001EE9C8F1|nr:TIP41-like protein [Homalodisca vitripennis]